MSLSVTLVSLRKRWCVVTGALAAWRGSAKPSHGAIRQFGSLMIFWGDYKHATGKGDHG